MPTSVRWSLFLWPPFVISAILLIFPQATFIWMSFHKSSGVGSVDAGFTLLNYARIVTDSFYWQSLWVTLRLSAVATVIALLFGFPSAYFLARLRSVWVRYLMILLLISSFVTIVIKVMGLSLLLGREGLVNDVLLALGIAGERLRFLNNEVGVLIGLVQYTLPVIVIMLFGVIQTIPPALEEAAEIHGTSWYRAIYRVVIPLSLPGLLAATLVVFNLNMGAFTSAILLGGGNVLTFPVLIQRKIFLDVDYSTGAALSTLLLVFVFVINLFAAALFRAPGRGTQR